MPRRRLAGLLLMLAMLQMAFAPAVYACVSHHAPVAHCHETVAGQDFGGAPNLAESLSRASGHPSHHSHHTQACCAAGDACRGMFFPASASAVNAPVTRAPLTPADLVAPTGRRAAPDSPPHQI
jgi:hypothetical protein